MNKLALNKPRLAALSLLGVGFTWGAAFVLMKDAIDQQPYMDFLATRFTLAAVVMAILRPKIATKVAKGDISWGLVLGLVLSLGFITQTIGLEITTAATSGFLTGLYVVITPILAWIFMRKSIGIRIGIGALVSVLGLAIFSGAAESTEFQVGQIWLVVCALLYALHILLLGKFGKGRNTYRFAMVQISGVALICWIFALQDGYQAPESFLVWFAIVFTAVFSTAIAFWVQTWAQTVLEPSRAALLMTSEVLFTAVIAIGVGQENLTLAVGVGGALMLAAMLIVEWPSKKQDLILEAHVF